MKIKDIGELRFIKRFKRKIKLDNTIVIGPGDDTAVIKWKKDKFLLFTCDMLIEDIHFTRRNSSPFQIGWKSMAVNISDIAAMGGVPRQAVVSLGLPKNTKLTFADNLFSGIKKAADKFNINITGGDVNTSKKIVVDISMLGEVRKKYLTLRSGAKRGDIIMVTGKLGGSQKGKHLKFNPRIKESQYLVRNFKLTSMMDISDGLSSDLFQISSASKVGAKIYESLIPVSREAKSLNHALSDGEDFELLFTVAKNNIKTLIDNFEKNTALSVTPIGQIVPKHKGVTVVDRHGRECPLSAKGYSHF